MAHRKTRSDLRTSVRYNLDESSASFWTDARLNDCLNRAIDRVWTEVRGLRADYFMTTRTSADGTTTILSESYDCASFQIVAGTTTSVTLPHDFSEMKLVETVQSGYEFVRWYHLDLAHPDFRALRRITDQITPSEFVYDIIDERTMIYAPKSDTTLDISITYTQAMPVLETDATELEMPHPFYEAVIDYATAIAMLQDRDPNAGVWEQYGRTIIAKTVGAHSRQIQDPEFVQDFLGDFR